VLFGAQTTLNTWISEGPLEYRVNLCRRSTILPGSVQCRVWSRLIDLHTRITLAFDTGSWESYRFLCFEELSIA